jgi:hypothetical protein
VANIVYYLRVQKGDALLDSKGIENEWDSGWAPIENKKIGRQSCGGKRGKDCSADEAAVI